jgi:hypothetical protein
MTEPPAQLRQPTISRDSMLLDTLMPEFDATRIEHLVVDAQPGVVYEAAINANLADALLRSQLVRALFGIRAAWERLAGMARKAEAVGPPEMDSLRLGELPEHGTWVALGKNPPAEFAFGVVGRFWAAETKWAEIDAAGFASYRAPGFARIAANVSVRSYGDRRTLLTYEARTQATDEHAKRAFLRYWTVVSPGVGIVMRSALALIADEACTSDSQA